MFTGLFMQMFMHLCLRLHDHPGHDCLGGRPSTDHAEIRMSGTPARYKTGWLSRERGVPVPPAGEIVPDAWPLQDALELGALPDAVPCARLHARQVLWEWGLTRLAATTELLVSELVTNAVAALRTANQVSPVRLWLLADRTRVLVLVWDASLRPPVPVIADQDAENGRGLLLVEAVSQCWDWYFPHDIGGKVVWALAGLEAPVPTR
jgi:anti-sigma regulatory factor (Ser/Thr protein kinase)